MALDDKTRTELEAAVFRRLVEHLRTRSDVQNIDVKWGVVTDFAISQRKQDTHPGEFRCPVPKITSGALTAPARSREISNEFDIASLNDP